MTVGLMSAGGAVKKGKEKKPQNPLQTFKKKSCKAE